MPLKPLQISSQANSSKKISQGSIVDFELHGKPQLGIVLTSSQGKWKILTGEGQLRELPSERLFLYSVRAPKHVLSRDAQARFVNELEEKLSGAAPIEIEELWKKVENDSSELSFEHLLNRYLPEKEAQTLEAEIALRRHLLKDSVYFKRSKHGFTPRSAGDIETRRAEADAKKRAKSELENQKRELVERASDTSKDITFSIDRFANLAASGMSAENAKETIAIVDEVIKRANLPCKGKPEIRTFCMLERLKLFSPDENLHFYRLGRPKHFSKVEISEANKAAEDIELSGRADISPMLSVAIDNSSTEDVDDALSVRETSSGFQLTVHISDVASSIAPDSPMDLLARRRGSSIYCMDETAHMLPNSLACGALSLTENEPRPTVSLSIDLDQDFAISDVSISLGTLSLTKRLSYEEVDSFLCKEENTLEGTPVEPLVSLLWDVSCGLEAQRISLGAQQFNRREKTIERDADGRLFLQANQDNTPAHKMIGEMMILANHAFALYAGCNDIPLYFRGQEPPDDEDGRRKAVPTGPALEYFERSLLKRSMISNTPIAHSSLGLSAYAQVTSPIRRYNDLVNQRQLVSYLTRGKPLYDESELAKLAEEFEGGVEQASRIQRGRQRYWLQKYLKQEKVSEVAATVVKVEGPKPLAEVDKLFILTPFTPCKKFGDIQSRLGERVQLEISRNDSRKALLRFSEKE